MDGVLFTDQGATPCPGFAALASPCQLLPPSWDPRLRGELLPSVRQGLDKVLHLLLHLGKLSECCLVCELCTAS